MAKFTEEELKVMQKRLDATATVPRKKRVFKEIGCEICGTQFTPKSSGSKFCSPECVKVAVLRRTKEWYRDNRQHGVGRGTLPPLDDGKGTLTVCPKCRGTYNKPEGDGSVKVKGAVGTSTEITAGVAFDTFRCACGDKWNRYK